MNDKCYEINIKEVHMYIHGEYYDTLTDFDILRSTPTALLLLDNETGRINYYPRDKGWVAVTIKNLEKGKD